MSKQNGNTRQPEAPATVNELPESRKAAWAQSMAMFQETGDKLDQAREEIGRLRAEIAGYKVALEAKDAIQAEAESRIQTMQLVRDEAIAQRAKYETLFGVVQAQLRAFHVPAVPLIKGADHDPAVA